MKQNESTRWKLVSTEITHATVKEKEPGSFEVNVTNSDTWHDTEDDVFVTNDNKRTFRFIPHDDLFEALNALKPFLAHISGYSKSLLLGQPGHADLDRFSIRGFTVSGEGAHEGVVLIGQVEVVCSKKMNLSTPILKWDIETNAYDHADELKEAVHGFRDEMVEYINGKRKKAAQLSLAV